MNQYIIDFDNVSQNAQELTMSTSPTDAEKNISQGINKAFEESFGEAIKDIGYQKVNFDIKINKEMVIVNQAYAIRDNGNVDIIEMKHKYRMSGHSISTSLRKRVSNLAMSFHLPTPFILFHQEMASTFKEGMAIKVIGASLIASLFALAGITPEQLLMGTGLFFMIALFDAVLGVMPNTKDGPDVKKEHTILSKFWKFVANLVAMAGLISIHLFTKNLVADPNWMQYIPLKIHYFGIGYLLLDYGYSIFKYIAVANNSKVPIPEVITKHFKKEE